jgi:hypothetical protein
MLAPQKSPQRSDGVTWSWPSRETFERFWRSGVEGPRPFTISRVAFAEIETLVVSLDRDENALYFEEYPRDWNLVLLEAYPLSPGHLLSPGRSKSTDFPVHLLWRVIEGSFGEVGELTIELDGPEKVQTLEIVQGELIDAERWAQWSYAAALIETPRPLHRPFLRDRTYSPPVDMPIWHRVIEALNSRDVQQTREVIDELLAREDISPTDPNWPAVFDFAVEQEDVDLARRIFVRWIPFTTEADDPYPMMIANSVASLCRRAGDLQCYLQLNLSNIAENIPGVVWPEPVGDADRRDSDSMFGVGIDARAFVLGMVLRFAGAPERAIEVPPARLGRAIAELEEPDAIVFGVIELVEDGALDAANRFFATVALYSTLESEYATLRRVCQSIGALDLHKLSRRWLESEGGGGCRPPEVTAPR